MMSEKTITLPAKYAAMTESEMANTSGGVNSDQLVKGTVAVGGALALTFAGGAVLKGLGSLLGDNIIGNFIGGVGSIATGIIGGGASLIVNSIGSLLDGVANAIGSVF